MMGDVGLMGVHAPGMSWREDALTSLAQLAAAPTPRSSASTPPRSPSRSTGVGPVDYIAQNGIQIGFGGTAIVQENQVSGNDYTPRSFVSCGLLIFDADGVRASQNHYASNERNVCVFGRGGGEFNPEP
jgi:hypothetical protein